MVEKNKGFQVFAHILMIFLTLCCLAPFILLFMSSFTSEDALIANGYSFFPAEFSAEAYRYILTDSHPFFPPTGSRSSSQLWGPSVT